MAVIIKDTKQVTEYSEDYRCGGYSTRTVTAYYCGSCKKELESASVRFCSHCGCVLKGIQDNIEERKREKIKPYETAYDHIFYFRNNFSKDSLEYKYLSETLEKINSDKAYISRI